MTYNELINNAIPVAKSDEIEVLAKDGIAYKIFSKNFSKKDVFYEAMLHATAENTGLNVPQINEILEIDDRIAISTQYIHGKTFAKLMEEKPDEIDEYLEKMVDIQLQVHAMTAVDIKKLKHKLKRDIDSLKELDYIKKYELMTRLESMPKHSKLCHGDFTPENLIVGEDGKIYIVDWVRATRGNASADIARSYLKLSLKSTEIAEKYIKLFCDKTKTQKMYVQQWLPIMAASLLAEGIKDEKEKAVAFAWLDVVDYE